MHRSAGLAGTWITVAMAAAVLSPWARAQDVCAGVAPVETTGLTSFPVVTGLTNQPLLVTAPPGDTLRIFVVGQTGTILIHRRGDPPGTTSLFLDLTDRVLSDEGERGLLGMAFDPDYATNGLFYLGYNSGEPGVHPHFTNVSRFTRDPLDPDRGDPDSEEIVLRLTVQGTAHQGGQVFFGLDGFLYVGIGDNGNLGAVPGTCGPAQDRATLLGKMLRLDVRGVDPQSLPPDCGGVASLYRIPSSNPFAQTGTADCGEILASGARNPWRSAIDAATGDLYVADVGEFCWEEVNVLPFGSPPGWNLGWRSMEATHCFDPAVPRNCAAAAVPCGGAPACGDPSLTLPVLEYSHDIGCAITGGFVYRGCQMPALRGTYFYGDYCTFIRSFRYAGGAATDQRDWTSAIDPTASLFVSLTSFGSDAQGEIYVTDRDGAVLRVAPPFADLEVSAPGAGAPFLLAPGDWSWEDLAFTTMHPVARHRVYRGTPGGAFHCIANSPVPSWTGDPLDPAPGQAFAYVVTAVSPAGQETRRGIAGSAFLLDACN